MQTEGIIGILCNILRVARLPEIKIITGNKVNPVKIPELFKTSTYTLTTY